MPQTDVPGEWTSPTQPFPTLPKPIYDRRLTVDDLIDYPIISKGCRERFESLRNEGPFTPPSLRGTVLNPGIAGGFNWGAGSINPEKGILVATFMDLPYSVKLVPRSDKMTAEADTEPYKSYDYPNYGATYKSEQGPLMSDYGIPCKKLPWGSIMAINLATGQELWRQPLGSMNGRIPLIGSWLNVGMPVIGGSMQTASGLVFVGASIDATFRAFDVASGKELWSAELPFSANATPMTYRLTKTGKQYVVVAAGGSATLGPKPGNRVVAYALPD